MSVARAHTRRATVTGRGRLVLAVLASAVLTGCAVHGLSFVQDDRVEIITPEQNEIVELPLEVRWSVKEYDGSFAVFFNRAPMRANRPMIDVVPEDHPCRADPDCPDAQWLADRHISITDEPRLVVEHLPDLRTGRTTRDVHELTIVLVDEDARRIGESAFITEFIIDRGE